MAFQGLFRRHNTFVVVKQIRLNAKETLEVGTVIDMKVDNVKWFQLRLWFRRRKIGTQDSDWVNQILGGARRPEGAAISTKRDVQNLVKTLSAIVGQKSEDHPPLIGLETEEGAKELSDVKVDKPADSPADKERRRKDAKNKRERERRAAKKAGK
jgi:hypothetical protein